MHMHMAPLALTFMLVGFWLALGWAVQAIINPRLASLPSLLLSPLIGFTVTLLPVFWLSMAGLPVGRFALPLTIVLACLAITGWGVKRPVWTRTDLLALGIVALAVFGSGLPTLVFGFDWLANANDDWANYNLGAIRLIDHGILHQPDIAAMESGLDYPEFLYFLTVAHDTRPGSELMLAWLGALTRQSPFFIFMPLILSFEAIMICATAALALMGARTRLHWFLGLTLAAVAPLSLYAIQQQLIAQLLGIAFTCGLAALTCIRLSDLAAWRRLILVAIVASGYLICYPEMLPFYGLAFVAFHVAHMRDGSWGWSRAWRVLLTPVGLLILLGPYLPSAVLFLLHQFAHSTTQGRFGGVSIFPYFLVPSGAAMLWGFLPFGTFVPEPWLSIAIVVALTLVGYTVLAAFLRMRAGSVMAGMLIIFTLVTGQLAWTHNDFGLFKIAMFVQPFLWFTLLGAIPGRRILPVMVAGVLGISTLYTDFEMTRTAIRDGSGGGIGIVGASRGHLLDSILHNSDPKWCDVDFETANLPLLKLLATRSGCSRVFSARFVGAFTIFDTDDYLGVNPLHRISGIDDFVRLSASHFMPKLSTTTFKRPDGSDVKVDYFDPKPSEVSGVGLTPNDENVVNPEHTEFLPIGRKADQKMHLEFIESSLGDHYYIPYFPITGMYATEPDPLLPGATIEAVGRFMLFKVVNPSAEVRLSIDISTTVIAGSSRSLPPAIVMGKTSASFGIVGNGSARVLSPPVRPLRIGNNTYVLLDLGRDASQLLRPRTGAMALYGRQYEVDYRVVTAFARRILVVDAADCDCESAPSSITDVKAALVDPNLLYSGIYEDGWIGQDGFARLADEQPGRAEFKFYVPRGIGISQGPVTLTVEGGANVTRPVALGTFTVSVPVEAGPHRISWHFANAGVLPGGDDRSVAARLQSFTIIPGPAGDDDASPTAAMVGLDKTLSDPSLANSGIELDGWLSRDGFISVKADAPGNVALQMMVPGGVGITKDDLTVTVDGGERVTRPLELGDNTVEVPVEKIGVHKIAWHFGATGTLPNGDGRTVGALLKSITLDHDGRAGQAVPSASDARP